MMAAISTNIHLDSQAMPLCNAEVTPCGTYHTSSRYFMLALPVDNTTTNPITIVTIKATYDQLATGGSKIPFDRMKAVTAIDTNQTKNKTIDGKNALKMSSLNPSCETKVATIG